MPPQLQDSATGGGFSQLSRQDSGKLQKSGIYVCGIFIAEIVSQCISPTKAVQRSTDKQAAFFIRYPVPIMKCAGIFHVAQDSGFDRLYRC